VSRLRPKQPRIRLDPTAYKALRKQVLTRDHRRCQNCGASKNLQVHHIRSRSKLGPDCSENLITLCGGCHESDHRNRQECGQAGAILSQTPGSQSNNVRSFVRLDGDTIAKGNNSPGIGGDALTRNDNTNEIQRIRRRDSNDFAGRLLIAHGSQRLNGHRQSKLLTQKAADESATPNLTAIFQAPQGDKQLAPFGKYCLAGKKLTEDDSIATEQHPASGFECSNMVVGFA
jgi:HNH endonuclease